MVGAEGGNASDETPPGGAGGFGAVLTADLTVYPYETFFVEVGSNGSPNGSATFGGGGASAYPAGSGGCGNRGSNAGGGGGGEAPASRWQPD